MNYTVILSRRAFADLDEIYDCIAAELRSAQNAAAQHLQALFLHP